MAMRRRGSSVEGGLVEAGFEEGRMELVVVVVEEADCVDGMGVGHVFVEERDGRTVVSLAVSGSGFRASCGRSGVADVVGVWVVSIFNVAKASSSFSPVPHEAQNLMYRETMVSKNVSCVLASDSRVSPFEGRP